MRMPASFRLMPERIRTRETATATPRCTAWLRMSIEPETRNSNAAQIRIVHRLSMLSASPRTSNSRPPRMTKKRTLENNPLPPRFHPNFDHREMQLLSAHYSNASPFRVRWRSKRAGLRAEAGSAGDRREPVQTVGPLIESGHHRPARRRMQPRKHALARLPRMKGLPRRSRMTKNGMHPR